METNNYMASFSDKITQSRFVHGSINISNSSNVSNSTNISDSNLIYNSHFVFNSNKVLESYNVGDSNNIVLSKTINDSKNIFNCFDICEGSELRNCSNVSSSYFCADCKEIQDCLFCFGLEQSELSTYYLFNKPVDEKRFNFIMKQYENFDLEMNYTNSWPEEIVVPIILRPHYNFDTHYKTLDEFFWEWVKTLPNYDPMVLYNITMNPLFLK